jgi:hypothetical protein
MGLPCTAYTLVCICNHACVPSVVTRFRSWKGATLVRVEALRDIPAGEELTLSYIDGRGLSLAYNRPLTL